MGEITVLLRAAGGGDAAAADRAIEALYGELRRMARARVGDGALTLMDATSLVHELYLRLQRLEGLDFPDRRHFLAYASRVMRSIVVDRVRERAAARRGSGEAALPLDTDLAAVVAAPQAPPAVLDVHEALTRLESLDERLAAIVQMRYFGGFTEREIAEALGVNERTVERQWQKARLVLARLLGPVDA